MLLKNHSENILLTEEAEDGETQVVDLYEYMSMTLYAWKNRLVEVNGEYSEYGAWTESIDFSINQTYGLVETESEEVTKPRFRQCNKIWGYNLSCSNQ